MLNLKLELDKLILIIFFISFCAGCSNSVSKNKIEKLIQRLNSDDCRVADKAEDALVKIGQPAVEPLITTLKVDNKHVRDNSLGALIKIGSLSVEPLISIANSGTNIADDDYLLRSNICSEVCEALGKIKDVRAVTSLIALLSDKSPQVRQSAANSLGEIKDSRAVEPLILLFKDKDECVRWTSASALGEIGDSRALPSVITLLDDQDMRVRQSAARALGKIGDKSVVPSLKASLTDWYVCEEVTESLEKLGWQPYSSEEKTHLLVAKRDAKGLKDNWPQTKSVLLQDITSGNLRAIENALYAFIRLGKEEVIEELIQLLDAKGTETTAEAFLNCGNQKLSEAAKQWAGRRGYVVESRPGYSRMGWGDWK